MSSPSPPTSVEDAPQRLLRNARALAAAVDRLRFAPPVAYVYNPLDYAAAAHRAYLERYGAGPKEVLLVGMNPGPWGMVQTGVPFGDVPMVRDWLGICAPVGRPPVEHPRRSVAGFGGTRREVSGQRLWGWARNRFGTPEQFFARFFVVNYCPLAFIEASGRNRTPDRLPRPERDALFRLCDQALASAIDALQPRFVLGIGRFAASRAAAVAEGRDLTVGGVPHPSPASPQANRGWEQLMDLALADLGICPP
jgi:single-strand selective monofunctional uracil DNA glycosylase